MRITVSNERVHIEASHINPELRINTDAEIVEYNNRIYLSTPTGQYWRDSWRGDVIELRNIYGKKLHSAGTKEVKAWGTPIYWDMMESEGTVVPEKVKRFYKKLKDFWMRGR